MITTRFKERDGKIVIHAHGDWNLGNIREIDSLLNEILEKNPTLIAINCKDLDSLDSTAIASLVKLLRKSREHEISLFFYDLNINIRHTFQLMTLDKFFTIITREQFDEEFGGDWD